MADKITLFDIPSKDKGCACWSLNTWKVRLALNYKKIDYETKWVEYPDIAHTLKSLGVPPGADKDTPYTLPAVRFPDGTHVMNSKFIIPEIEKRYPAPEYPALFLDDPATARVYAVISDAFDALGPLILPAVPAKVLNDVSAEYFHRTRSQWVGMSLEDFARQKGGEPAWQAGTEVFARMADLFKESGGPFVRGGTFSWPDIILVGFLHFFHRLVGDEEFKRLEQWPELIAVYQASQELLQRDSH